MKSELIKPAIVVILAMFLVCAFTFRVRGGTGDPPSASFAYWPTNPYLNMTVTFDASASSPEGFNDVITRFEWDFGDGSPKVVKTGNPPDPIITRAFLQIKTFIVTLNATDSEGLWSTTSKPLTTLPEFGPTANFTWTPTSPIINQTTTFDASNSTTGWSAKTRRYSPLQTYIWNFSDGTGNITITNPIITHGFTQPGSFLVRLTVVDADGRSAQTSATIQVQNITGKTYDVNGDGKIDSRDVYAVARAFGSRPGDPNWDARCDFNKDNKVDTRDYYPVCQHYGQDP